MANPTLTQSLTARSILGKRTIQIDPTIGWDITNYNIGAINLRWDPIGRAYAEVAVKPRDLFPAYKNNTLPVIFLSTTGNDNTGNGSQSTPYLSLSKAFSVINTVGAPYLIRMAGGTYQRTRGGTNGMNTPLNVSGCVIEAYNGAVTITTHDDLSWTVNSTYSWVYQTNRVSVGSAIWLDRPQPHMNGLHQEVRWVSSLAECSRNPGTMYTDGTVLYAYHPNGAAVSNTNTRVFLNANNILLNGTTQLSFLMTGRQEGDYIELQGGTSGGFSVAYTGGAGVAKVVIGLEQVRCRYNSNQATVTNQPNNVSIDSVNGLFYAYNCEASAAGLDNWSARNTLNADMSYLTVNCIGADAGRFAANGSNGYAWSDSNIKLVDVAGYYWATRGITIQGNGSVKAHLIGTIGEKSIGDRSNGGMNDAQELGASDTTTLIGDYLQIRPWGATGNPIVANDGAKISLRNMLPFSGGNRTTNANAAITISYLR